MFLLNPAYFCLGNFVHYNKQVFKIESIDFKGEISLCSLCGKIKVTTRLEQIFRIKLSSEHLKNLGFQNFGGDENKTTKWKYLCDYNSDYFYVYQKNLINNLFAFFISFESYDPLNFKSSPINLNYVDELQNLMLLLRRVNLNSYKGF